MFVGLCLICGDALLIELGAAPSYSITARDAA